MKHEITQRLAFEQRSPQSESAKAAMTLRRVEPEAGLSNPIGGCDARVTTHPRNSCSTDPVILAQIHRSGVMVFPTCISVAAMSYFPNRTPYT